MLSLKQNILNLIAIIKPIQDTLNLIQDSLFQRESLFAQHLLTPIHSNQVYNNSSILIWPTIILGIVLILSVSIKTYDPKKIIQLISCSFSNQKSKQLYRDDYKLTGRVSVFFTINFLLLISFLFFKTNQYFNNNLFSQHNALIQYLLFVFVVLSVYAIKFFGTRFFSYVFKKEDLEKEYLFNLFVFYHTLSIVLFPFLVLLQFSTFFSDYFLFSAIVIVSMFYFLRLFRILLISYSEQNIGIIQIFLYFCAVEILPLLILVRFLFVNF